MHRSSATGSSRTEAPSIPDKLALELVRKSLSVAVYMSDFIENVTLITSAASILSAAQLLHFTFGSPLFERFGSPVFSYVSAGVRSLVVPATHDPIHQDSISYLLVAILGACLVWFIGYYCFILFSVKEDGRLGGTLKLVLKLSCLFYLITESLLVVIISQLTGITMMCTLNSSGMGSSKIKCRSSGNILDWLLIALLGIPFLCYVMFLKLLFATPNPLSKSPKAGFNPSREKLLFCLKIILPIQQLLLDSSTASLFLNCAIGLAGHSLVLHTAWKCPECPHTGTSLLHSCLDVLQVTSAAFCFGLWVCSLVSPADGWQSKSLIYLLIGSVVSIAIGFWLEIKKSEAFRADLIFLSPSEEEVERYFFTLVLRVDNFGATDQKTLAAWLALKGVSDHLQKVMSRQRAVPQQLLNAAAQLKALQTTNSNEQTAVKSQGFEVVLHLMDWAISEHPQRKYYRLRIAQASIHCEKRKNPWKSYHCLEGLSHQSELPWFMKLARAHLYEHIQGILVNQDFLQSTLTGRSTMSIITQFDSSNRLLDLIRKNTENYRSLWKMFSSPTLPAASLVYGLAREMVSNHEGIKKEFTELTSVNPSSPSHLPSLFLFGNYLQYAVNNMQEAKKPLRQAHLTSQAVAAAGLDKSNANAKSAMDLDACVFILSAEQKDLGRLCTTNGEVLRYFGWTAAEVENRQIEEFMPRVLADQHQAFMKRVFETTDMKAIEKVRPIFALDRLGFAIALRLVVRVLPRLDGGLRLVGTFTPPEKELEQAPVLVLNAKDGNLEAVTYNSYVRYGIHPCLCSDFHRRKNFSILNLFPKIRTLEQLIDAANRRTEVLIDTTKLLNREITPGYVWKDSRLPERQTDANSSHKVKLSIHSRSTHGAENFELIYLLVNPLNIGPADNVEMNLFLDMAAQFKTIRPVRSKSRTKEPTQIQPPPEQTETQSKGSKSSVLKFRRSVKTLGLFSKTGVSRLKTKLMGSNPMISDFNRTETVADPEAETAEEEQSNWEKEQARREHSGGRNGRIVSVFVLYLVNLVFTTLAFFVVYQFQVFRCGLDEMKLSILSSSTQLQYQLTRSLITSQGLYLAGFNPAALQPQTFSAQQAEQNLVLARAETNSLVKLILSKSETVQNTGLEFMQEDIHLVFSPGRYEANLDGRKYTLTLTLSELAYTIVNFLESLMAITLSPTGNAETHKSQLGETFYFLQMNTFTSLEAELQSKVQLLEGFFRESISQVTWTNLSLLIGIFLFVLVIEGLSMCLFVPLFQSIAYTVVPFGLLPADDLQLLHQRADDFYEEHLKIVREDSDELSEDESSFHTDSSGQSELDADKKIPEGAGQQRPTSNNGISNFFTAFNPQASISISRTTSLRSIDVKGEQNQKRLRYQRSRSFNDNDEPRLEVSGVDREVASPSKGDLDRPSAQNTSPIRPTTLVSMIANGPTPRAADIRVGLLAPKKKQVRIKVETPKSPGKKAQEPNVEGKTPPMQRRQFRFTTTKLGSFHQLNKEKYALGGPTVPLIPEPVQIEELPLSPPKPAFKLAKKPNTKKKQAILAVELPSEQETVAVQKKVLEDRVGKRKLFSSHFLSVIVVVCLLFPTASIITFRESTASSVIDTVTDFSKVIFRTLNAMERIEAASLRLMLVSEDFDQINFDGLVENVRRIEAAEEEIRDMALALTVMEIDQKGLPSTIKEALVLYLDLANQPICGPDILGLVSGEIEDAKTFRAACEANPNPDKGLNWLVTQVQLQGVTVKDTFLRSTLSTEADKKGFWWATSPQRATLRTLIRVYSRFVRLYMVYLMEKLALYHQDTNYTNLVIFLLSSAGGIAAFIYGGIWYLGRLQQTSRQSKAILGLIPSDLIQCNPTLQAELKSFYRTL